MNDRQEKIRLCFSIPELDANTHTHHFHVYELLEEIGKQLDVFVLVDRAASDRYPLKNVSGVYVSRFNAFPLRKIEQFLILFFARLKGNKRFYVHYSLWNALMASLIAKVLGGKTYLWSCHSYCRVRLKEIDSLKKLGQWFTGVLQIVTFKSVDCIVTGTPSVANKYVKEFGASKDKFVIIPNWVNTDRFYPRPFVGEDGKNRKKTVAFIHSLTYEKGAMHLPSILSEVATRKSDVDFLIIGDGIYGDYIRKAIEKSGLRNIVKMVGHIPNTRIPVYLSSIDLLILPSENEGFPRALIEAMAMGVPFVATDVGGILDIVTPFQKQFVVKRGDIKEFSRKVVELLNDENKLKLLKEDGLAHVKKFTLPKVSEMFLEMIRGRC